MELIDKHKIEEILRNLWKEDDSHNAEHRICYNKALQDVLYKIDTLEVKKVDLDEERIKQPTLPSNINEAAEKHAKECLDLKFPTLDPKCIKSNVIYTFKAGAEWMAKHQVIWHDADNEQPNGTKTVIAYDPNTKSIEVLKNCIEIFTGNKWCYIDDYLI